MAVKKLDNTKTLSGWNSKIFFPKDQYILRCVSEKVGNSNSGKPMVTLEWEVVNQEPKQIGDKMFDFDGVKFTSYHVLREVDPQLSEEERNKKSDSYFASYQERVLVPCGIDCSDGWDDENPPTVKGKIVYASVYGKENKSYKSPTPEQQAKGQKVGDPMIDPVTNKEIIVYQPNIETIFGVADVEVKRPL